jgi:hypothetical protein
MPDQTILDRIIGIHGDETMGVIGKYMTQLREYRDLQTKWLKEWNASAPIQVFLPDRALSVKRERGRRCPHNPSQPRK